MNKTESLDKIAGRIELNEKLKLAGVNTLAFGGFTLSTLSVATTFSYMLDLFDAAVKLNGGAAAFSSLGFLVEGLGAAVFATLGVSSCEIGNNLRTKHRTLEEFKRAALIYNPGWAAVPPDEDEYYQFQSRLLNLPPIGSKVPELKIGKKVSRKKPNEDYVVQFTVQGRLHDKFKYAALALITSSPYRNDWQRPYFQAPWGECAPLVHDGGNVNTSLNHKWYGLSYPGRTDFLQRVGVAYEPKFDEISKMSQINLSRLPVEQLARARLEEFERERLLMEMKFYQRIALVSHTTTDHLPYQILKQDSVRPLKRQWYTFEDRMNKMYREFGIEEVTSPVWFLDEPRNLWPNKYLGPLFGLRLEADWEPIQEQLINLEETRWKHPEMIKEARQIMIETTNNVDRIIGLVPSNRSTIVA